MANAYLSINSRFKTELKSINDNSTRGLSVNSKLDSNGGRPWLHYAKCNQPFVSNGTKKTWSWVECGRTRQCIRARISDWWQRIFTEPTERCNGALSTRLTKTPRSYGRDEKRGSETLIRELHASNNSSSHRWSSLGHIPEEHWVAQRRFEE